MAHKANTGGLNDKQERFCREFVIDSNGTKAAERAGYSKKTAKIQASQLLTILNVQNRIKELTSEVEKQLFFKAHDVLTETGRIAFSNIQDFLDPDNEFKDISKIDRAIAASVQSIKVTETTVGVEFPVTTKKIEIKLYDKLKANEMLGKYFKLWIEQVDLSSGGKPLSPLSWFNGEKL
jgi:phage terminase small subunit